MRCLEVMEKLEELSPSMYAEKWDNVGLLVGRKEKEVRRIYVVLDAKTSVIEKAIAWKADLILTHHPMIFSPLKSITADHFIGRRVLKLIQEDICLYSMHTNFDVMGMADAAADEIGLKKRKVLDITYEDEIAKEGFGRVGMLPQIMTLSECATFIKDKFHIPSVRVFGPLDAELEYAAISPGSGKSEIEPAIRAGADVLITGDIDHHDGLDAVERGLYVIDAGHFGLEQIFMPYIRDYIHREMSDMEIMIDDSEAPFVTV